MPKNRIGTASIGLSKYVHIEYTLCIYHEHFECIVYVLYAFFVYYVQTVCTVCVLYTYRPFYGALDHWVSHVLTIKQLPLIPHQDHHHREQK